MLLYNTVQACGGPCFSDRPGDCDNCIDVEDSNNFLIIFQKILLPIFIYLGIIALISFFITLGFYLVFRHKNDKHPWKHAIRRSWPRWIIVFLTPLILLGVYLMV